MDTTHLEAHRVGLNNARERLSRERCRLANATTEAERKQRSVWVSQAEKEVAELEKLVGGMDAAQAEATPEMSDAEILAELGLDFLD